MNVGIETPQVTLKFYIFVLHCTILIVKYTSESAMLMVQINHTHLCSFTTIHKCNAGS